MLMCQALGQTTLLYFEKNVCIIMCSKQMVLKLPFILYSCNFAAGVLCYLIHDANEIALVLSKMCMFICSVVLVYFNKYF